MPMGGLIHGYVQNPMINPSRRKVTQQRSAQNGHYQGQHTHLSQTNFVSNKQISYDKARHPFNYIPIPP